MRINSELRRFYLTLLPPEQHCLPAHTQSKATMLFIQTQMLCNISVNHCFTWEMKTEKKDLHLS